MIGDKEVGKTSFMHKLGVKFPHVQTIDNCNICFYSLKHKEKYHELELLDAGRDFDMTKNATWNAFIIMYSVDSINSLDIAKILKRRIVRKFKTGEKYSIVLVANKCDIIHQQDAISSGEKYANEWNIPFVKISIKTGKDIEVPLKLSINKLHTNKAMDGCYAWMMCCACIVMLIIIIMIPVLQSSL